MRSPHPPTSRLLVTDLDGTLVGHREGLHRLLAVLAPRRDRWTLAYATGRTLFQAQRLAREEGLPTPDFWLTEVGAAIADAQDRPDEAWRARMEARWRRRAVQEVVARFPQLSPQPDEAQGRFKLSFHLDPCVARTLLPELRRALREARSGAQIVFSSDRDLDIVPLDAGKGKAVTHLAGRLGVPLERVLTCGDSANDLEMLKLGCPAVAVGNAWCELLSQPLPPTVLRARGECALGILEALDHFRWLDEGESA